MSEEIEVGIDTVVAAATLTWSFLGSLRDTVFDFLSGRRLPEPDLKSVANAPEPGAICRIRTPKAIPRASRSSIRHDQAA